MKGQTMTTQQNEPIDALVLIDRPDRVAPCCLCGKECWSGEGNPEDVRSKFLCICSECAAQAVCDQDPAANYFGTCPECGRCDGYVNVGKSHWFYCQRHETRWSPGSNLFSSWRYETEAEQREKSAFMYEGEGYRVVEPLTPTQWLAPEARAAANHILSLDENIVAMDEDIPF
jgi:hypothetical protein